VTMIDHKSMKRKKCTKKFRNIWTRIQIWKEWTY